jgi:sugar phosphate isomerase/epimerase
MQSHTRREFIRSSSAVGLAAVADALCPSLAKAEAMGLPAGIQLYAVREDFAKDTPGTLKQLRQIGFVEVETAGFGRYSARDFRKLLDDSGLKAPSAHLRLSPSDYAAAFDDARTIGSRYATTSSLHTTLAAPRAAELSRGARSSSTAVGLDGFKRLADAMNDLGAKAKAAGLQYAYHNHNYEFEKLPDGSYGYDLLVGQTDHELVKFEIDCGWMCAAGADPVSYMKRFPGRFTMLHVKEFQPMSMPSTSLSGPTRPKGTDLGQGFIDYKPIFAMGKAAGVQHAFAEQEDPFPSSQMASAKVAYSFLHAAR